MNIYNSFKNVVEENISQECRLKDVDETRNYFLEEIEENELRSIKLKKKSFIQLQIILNTLILDSAITGWIHFLFLLLCLVFIWILQALQ